MRTCCHNKSFDVGQASTMYRTAYPSQWVIAQMMDHHHHNQQHQQQHPENRTGQSATPKYSFPGYYAGCVGMVPLMSLEAGTARGGFVPKAHHQVGLDKRPAPPPPPPSVHWKNENNNRGSVAAGAVTRYCGGGNNRPPPPPPWPAAAAGATGCSQYKGGAHLARDYRYHRGMNCNNDILSRPSSQGPRIVNSSTATSTSTHSATTLTPATSKTTIRRRGSYGSTESLAGGIHLEAFGSVSTLVHKGVKRPLDVSPVIDNRSGKGGCIGRRYSVAVTTPTPTPSTNFDPDVVYVTAKRKAPYGDHPCEAQPSNDGGSGHGSNNGALGNVGSPRNGRALPRNLLDGSQWDELSYQMWDKFMLSKQSDAMFQKKMKLYGVLSSIMKESYPSCGLYVVGSSMNRFGTNKSDMDACLMLTHDDDIDQRFDALNILQGVLQVIRKFDFFVKSELIRAKVPIVAFQDTVSGVEVDLNLNNAVGIRNTYLLRSYSNIDWRVCPLVLIVKIWARIHDINDAKNMTISSYSLALMVIHYLQYGVKPPVLPCIQKLFPHKFLPEVDVRNLTLDDKFDVEPSQNGQPLGQLLLGFFRYFTKEFDFQNEAISVRLGRSIPKTTAMFQNTKKNNPGMWKCLCIEEPFDKTNTARSVYDEEVFRRIKNVFVTSFSRLERNKTLTSIF